MQILYTAGWDAGVHETACCRLKLMAKGQSHLKLAAKVAELLV